MSHRMNAEEYRVYYALLKQEDKLSAQLFRLRLPWTLDDYRKARGPAYWAALDAIPLKKKADRLKFQINNAKKYNNERGI